MCGEKYYWRAFFAYRKGSPPRVWGKVAAAVHVVLRLRITPTCVGKSIAQLRTGQYFEDHPHVCGEKAIRLSLCRLLLGSPPRVWGKVFAKFFQFVNPGITPTCVGKSYHHPASPDPYKDHPHVCGEKLPYHQSAVSALGSPPRVWGKVLPKTAVECPHRITPTCVGKSYHHPASPDPYKDHPHVCGEKNLIIFWKAEQIHFSCDFQMLSLRITPTCVGKRISSYSGFIMPGISVMQIPPLFLRLSGVPCHKLFRDRYRKS